MADYLLGIDYGTGGAKACIIDTQGAVLGFAFEEYPFIHEKPGWSEHEPNLYWTIGCRLIQQTLAHAHVVPAEVRGLAVSSALPSLVMVDAEHRPIHNAYNLLDRRATQEVAWLRSHVGEERIVQLTGNRIDDHPVLVNLLWEQRHRPDDYHRIWKALTIDGFITLKLTGQAVVSNGGAAFYGVAFDLQNDCFDEDMLAAVGIAPGILPAIHGSEAIIGSVTTEAAAATGLAAGTPVSCGQVDFSASCIAAGITAEGDIMSNLGTVGNFGVVHKNKAFNFSALGATMINWAFTVGSADTYVTAPTTMTGGQSIRFLRDAFGQYEMETERVLGVSAYDLLNFQAEKIAPGSDGLLVLPYLMGERTPIWDTAARGVIFGLSLNHTKGHLVRAMMEAVAYALYDSYELLLQAGLPIKYPLVLNEGGAVSKLWRQIITDVFNVPTVLVQRRTGAPYGDAILAGVATGVLPNFDVAKQWVQYVATLDPDPVRHARYMEYFALYRRLYGHVKEDFQTLAALRELPPPA
jgi:sugar (pentulose or hexulose) kinase